VKAQRALKRRPIAALDVRPFRFERRAEGRTTIEGSAMAAFYDEDGALSLTHVRLLDQSEHGLGLISPVRVEPGASFSLHARGRSLPHTTGTVARCVEAEDGFTIGLRCDPRRAA
jgi:hypothetical protein